MRRKKILDSPLHSIKSKEISNQSDIAEEDQEELDQIQQREMTKRNQKERMGSENFPEGMMKELKTKDFMAKEQGLHRL